MTAELRPCIIRQFAGENMYSDRYESRKALFHCWEQVYKFNDFDGFMLGVVELENGQVCMVEPEAIRFCDNKMSEYVFEGAEE